jgi:hypothetical protein
MAHGTMTRSDRARRDQRGAPVAEQLRRRRRAQAEAMLRGIARSQAGQPAGNVRLLLSQAFRGGHVRPSPAKLDELAAAIAAGRPVALP